MDGFALDSGSSSAATPSSPALLRVSHHIAAGSSSGQHLGQGECARIMTGAPVPPGADAVLPFEDVEDRGDTISVFSPVQPGSCVRPHGQDVRRGQTVLQAGTELNAAALGLLAALGHDSAPVTRKPKVAVLSTGDELVSPGRFLRAGQIYNSNTPMLAAAIDEAGGIPQPCETVPDDPEAIAEAMRVPDGTDLVLTSGGASVGDFDHMRDVLGDSGDLHFWKVRVRPGKPLLFGELDGIPIIGLPGNPTSAMVTFEEFVRPAIRLMLGAPLDRPQITAVLDDEIDNRGGRKTYARVRLRFEAGQFHAALAGPQDSAMLLPLAAADGLLVIPEDKDRLLEGERAMVQVWRLPSS